MVECKEILIRSYVVSSIKGRIRLRHHLLMSVQLAEGLKDKFNSLDGVISCEANTLTGSLLIFYDYAVANEADILKIFTDAIESATESKSSPSGEEQQTQKKSSDEMNFTSATPYNLIGKAYSSNRCRKFIVRGMLISAIATLVSAVTGIKSLHLIAGSVLTITMGIHTCAHSKQL